METEGKYKQPKETERFKLPDLELPKLYTKICCPACEKEVVSDNLNINDKIAKCGSCNAVFPFADDLQQFDLMPKKIKQEIMRPEGIDLFYYKEELEVSFRRLFRPWEIFFSIVGGQIGFGFLTGITSSATTILGKLFGFVPLIMLALFLVTRLRQKTYLNVTDKKLIISHKPNFLNKVKIYRVENIDQVYVKKSTKSSAWEVMLLINEGNGQKHVSLSTVRSASKAKFLEQELERYLMIQDVVVPEES